MLSTSLHERHNYFQLAPSCSFLIMQSERPEEEYDSRTLYERLKVQRDRKQEEWEEQFKFSESVKTIHEQS